MRYFFNVAGVVSDPDDKGQEFGSLSEARIEAARYGADYLRERPQLVWMGEEFRVEVTDDEGATLFTFIAVGVDAQAETGRVRI